VSAAAEFVREVEHAVQRVREWPERYPLTRKGRRRFVLLKFPFDVVYRIVENGIEIVAVAPQQASWVLAASLIGARTSKWHDTVNG
jgi:plasmid stabilization system protein ParE